ncbi:hypothetical protein OAU02_01450 [Candidatus Pseudothioglobus singularis]|nr:hypothetical protein [Candidatus Pseudothioglobus singularis]
MLNDVIICLGAGNAQLPLIIKANETGYPVVTIDQNPKAPGFDLAIEKIIISTYEDTLVISRLEELQSKYNYIGIVARTSGPALYTASAIANHFNLPGLSSEIVPLATKKSRLRKFCEINNLPFPKGLMVSYLNELTEKINLPVIVKPDLPLVGKKEVKLINTHDQLEESIRLARQASFDNKVEIEEFIEGFDVGCLFDVTGKESTVIAYWDELVGIDKKGLIKGCGVSVPSVITGTDIEQKIKIIVEKFTKSLSNEINALLIMALRIDFKGNPFIIELHADLGGDLIADELFPIADDNYDYFKSCIKKSLEGKQGIRVPSFTPSAIIYRNIFDNETRREIAEVIVSDSMQTHIASISRELLKYNKDLLFVPGVTDSKYIKN